MTTTETVSARASVEGASFDGAKAEAFGGHIMSILTGSLLSSMVDIGRRTGLFPAAAEGPATSEQLAARAELCEQYVREWLGAVTAGGIVEYDEATGTFSCRPSTPRCSPPRSGSARWRWRTPCWPGTSTRSCRFSRRAAACPTRRSSPEFTDAMDAMGREVFDTMLLDGYLPLAPGLAETLAAGARVADVACGTGHALVILAQAFPASTFTGYDLDEHAIARGRAEATGACCSCGNRTPPTRSPGTSRTRWRPSSIRPAPCTA